MIKKEIVQYIESYADWFSAPVKEGVNVTGLKQFEFGRFSLTTRNASLRKAARDSGKFLRFADDLLTNLDQADAVAENIKNAIDDYIAKHQIEAPVEPRYIPVWRPEKEIAELDYRAANIRTVIWCLGFQLDYGWIEIPVFNGKVTRVTIAA